MIMSLFKKRRYYFTDSSFASDTIIADCMGGIALIIEVVSVCNAMEGGETKTALWTLALLLFLISLLFIFLIHILSRKKPEDAGAKAVSKKSSLTSAKQN